MTCNCSKCSAVGDGHTPTGGQAFDAVEFRDLQRGVDLFHAFKRAGPSRVMKVRHSRVIPPVVVELGELVGLIYRSGKGQPGQPLTYIHRMENPPRLVSNIDGTQLYVVGGSYRVTPQGIEG